MSSERNIISRLLDQRLLLDERNIVIEKVVEKTPDELYEDYLYKHIEGVVDAYNLIIKPILVKDGVDEETLSKIEYLVNNHDASKRDEEEWKAYRDYFYDKENNPRSSEAFNYAWKHHQNHNPHHWNYWCLINDCDEPQIQPLDMPFEYIIEMLADWHSAGSHYGNTANDWYCKQKGKMMLSPKTREILESYLDKFGKDF